MVKTMQKMISGIFKPFVWIGVSMAAMAVVFACGGTETVTEIVEVEVPGETIIVEKEVVKTVEVPGETKEIIVEKEVVKTVEVPGETVIVKEEVVKSVPKEVVVTEKVTEYIVEEVVRPREPEGNVYVGSSLIQPLVQLQFKDANGTVGGPGADLEIYEGIIRAKLSKPGVPPSQEFYVPDLASAWSVKYDFSQITFDIRDDVSWHDGYGNLTAEDVVWTFNDSFREGSISNAGEQLSPGHRKGWRTDGTYTAIMEVHEGQFDYTWGVYHGGIGWDSTFGIVCKACYEQLGEDDFITTPIGTGKYRAIKWVGHDVVETEAISNHWSGQVPYINKVYNYEMPEQATREAALKTGELDFAQVPVKRLQDVVGSIGGSALEMGMPFAQTIYMSGNYWAEACPSCSDEEQDLVANPRPGYTPDSDHPWIGRYGDDESMENARKVRWAMSMAIDREKILANVLGGFGQIAYTAMHTQFPPGDKYFQDEWIVPFDPELARQYLAEAGYSDGFDVVFWATASVPEVWDPEIADAVGEMWQEHLNLNVTVDHSPYASRRPETVTKHMNVPWLHGWGRPPGGSKAAFFCPTPGHLGGVEMPKEICDVGYRNDTEPDLTTRILNNVEFQNYMQHWHLNPAIVTMSGYWVQQPWVKQWHPYFGSYFNNPSSVIIER